MPASTEAPRNPPPADFAAVFARLAPHRAALDTFLHQEVGAFEPEIRAMAEYCIDTSGKRIRPALVFLSGWQGDGVVSPDLVRVAAVIELIHLATLVHDDIMDEAELRRGRRTAAREYGAEAAVLLGDALFSHAVHLAAQFPTTEVCLAVSESMRKVCAGEIIQTLRRGTLNVSRSDYFRVIDLKTAELFRVSCALGSRLGGADAARVEATARFGRHLGIAYQIYDDLVDFFGSERVIGKTLGTDLASGKLTLPLLALSDRLPEAERSVLRDEIQGRRVADLGKRVAEMHEHGVYVAVRKELEAELAEGLAALEPFEAEAGVKLLRTLADALRQQVDALTPR